MKFLTVFSLFFFGLCAQAQAQQADFLPKGDANQPIEIQADNLEVLQKDKVALFRGNVEAKQGNVRLKADEMRVHYKEKAEGKKASNTTTEGQNSVSKIDVNGNVFLATPQETVQGSKGVYDVERSMITLTDQVVITRGKNILKGAGLTYNLKTGYSEMKSAPAIGTDGKKQRVRGIFVPEKTKKP